MTERTSSRAWLPSFDVSRWTDSTLAVGLVIALVVAGLFMGLYTWEYVNESANPDYVGPFSRLEFPLVDLRFRLLSDPSAARDDIVIVAITGQSIDRFRDTLGRWPWPRRVFAALFRHVRQADMVLTDVGFWEPSKAELTPAQVDAMRDQLKSLRREWSASGTARAGTSYRRLLNNLRSLAVSDDRTLARYTERYGPVYHSMTFTHDRREERNVGSKRQKALFDRYGYAIEHSEPVPRFSSVTPPIAELLDPSAGIGHIRLHTDPDGPLRRFNPFLGLKSTPDDPISRPFLPSLAVAGVLGGRDQEHPVHYGPRNIVLGDGYRIPRDRWDRVLVNYHGVNPYRVIPVDVLLASIYGMDDRSVSSRPPSWFAGKKVLVGATAPGLFDLAATPTGGRTPGIVFQAHVLDMLLEKNFLEPIRLNETLWSIGLVTILVGVLTSLFSPLVSTVAAVLGGTVFLSFGFYSFETNNLMNLTAPMVSGTVCYGTVMVYRLWFERRRRRRIKRVFSRYLPPSVMDEVLKEPDDLELGGERREITVLFADVAGFTAFSEARPVEDVAAAINDLLTRMTECVFNHHGVLDKYIGDALVAEFGIVPGEPEDHVRRACLAALDIRDRIGGTEVTPRGDNGVLDVRMGVHTGVAAAGNMGSRMLFDYTAIGDTMNLAARLEGVNKHYGTRLIVSEMTYRRVSDHVEARELDRVVVRGRDEAVTIYELLGRHGTLEDGQLELARRYEQALALYRDRQWEEAFRCCEEILEVTPDDGPTILLRERCQEFLDHPPDDEWKPVNRIE